jgi:hypothetical protein
MTPTLHVRIYTQAASWLRSQARANRRSVGAETQFVVEQAMVRAELAQRASVALKLSLADTAKCKKCLGRKRKAGLTGWSVPRNVKLTASEKLYVRGMGKLCEEDRA